jgi:hypothetical protein
MREFGTTSKMKVMALDLMKLNLLIIGLKIK